MISTDEDAIFPIQTQYGIVFGETTRQKWGLPVYVVVNGNSYNYFEGETGYTDAHRYYWDLLLPITYGRK